ncbi:restriction endonuclease subunit S [Pantoea agglomerans]|uniref:restriction endonuclease subunit S n=1 Tax=Enterobacter agglomerans TaxID=549 RepID=UPI003207E291
MSVEKKVPEIRFKGFSGEWDKYPLAKFISSLDAGVSVNSGDRPANQNEFGILKTSCVTNGFFEPNENKVVFKTEEISRLKQPVLENTIIISRMNTPALVGANAYVSRGYANYFLPDRLWAAKPTSIGDLKFIAYILGSDKGRLALSNLATGTSGSMKNISKPAVLQLELRAPKETEQTQIGSYFLKLDALINQHQQKHAKLSSIKKAMLGKMFPKPGETIPEIRFKGFSREWRTSELSNLALFNPKSELPNFFKYVDLESVKGTSLIGYKFVSRNDAPSRAQRHAQKGDVFYQTVRPYQKNNYLFNSEENDYVFSTGYAQLRPYFNGYFLLNLVQRDSFVKNVLDSCTGTSYPAINASTLATLEVSYPECEMEQNQIGNFFQKLDMLINQHHQQITKLNNIKQACLSKMFV